MRCGFLEGTFSELMAVFVGVFRLGGFLFGDFIKGKVQELGLL